MENNTTIKSDTLINRKEVTYEHNKNTNSCNPSVC